MCCSFNTQTVSGKACLPATLDSRVEALDTTALVAKKYYFMISRADSTYGNDSLHLQALLNSLKPSFSLKESLGSKLTA